MNLKIIKLPGGMRTLKWRLYDAETNETLGYYRTHKEANDEKKEAERTKPTS
jgi:hypothetical protein